MKLSFKSLIEETIKDELSWNYYSAQLPVSIDDFDSCREFIKSFILAGGKESVLVSKIDKLDNFRVQHICSLFFIGIYIYKYSSKINVAIDKSMKRFPEKKFKSRIEFSYIWFLLCLFHDLGYKEETNPTIGYSSFDDFKRDNKLSSLGSISGVPKFYKSVYEQYFNNRIYNENKIDHGIYASFFLYHDLKKHRAEKEKLINENWNNNPNLCYEKKLDLVYNYSAWIILAHNIWFTNTSEKALTERYNQAGLGELVLKENEYKIALQKHPFLFLFCLVDTIEPIKRIKEFSLFDKITLDLSNVNELIIESHLSCGCHDAVLNQVNSLGKWLIKAESIDNGVKIIL